jgi:hypothetical protein
MALNKKAALTGGFLAVTAAALGWEFYAGLDSSAGTQPWTELISTYIPQPITIAVLTLLSTWLPIHFAHAYKGQSLPPSKVAKFITAIVTAAAGSLTLALSDNKLDKSELIGIAALILGAITTYLVPNKTPAVDPVPAPADVPIMLRDSAPMPTTDPRPDSTLINPGGRAGARHRVEDGHLGDDEHR